MSHTVWDLETGTRTLFKRKASPWHPENFIVATGWKRAKQEPDWHYTSSKAVPLPEDWFTSMLEGTRILVGFNIGFDLLWALQDKRNLEAWMDWIAKGGQIWDCQLAEYLLDGMVQEAQMLSLNEVAPRYGGTTKVDEVKVLWEAGVMTEDIDPDLLKRYLIGERDDKGKWKDFGDIGNTELAFLGQLKKARGRGQLKSLLLNMGALVAVVEMMRNGMHVDKARGLVIAAELRAELAGYTEELRGYLPADLPFEFNWTNRYHLSPLIFGGSVNYKAREYVLDEEGNKTYYQKDELHVVLDNDTTISLDDWNNGLAPEGTNAVRFAGGKNKGEIKTKKVKVPDLERGAKTRIGEFSYDFPRMTEPDDKWASSTPGLWSVAGEVIEELGLRDDVPFLVTLSKVAALTKDLGTYYITEDEEPKGMLTLVGDDGIVHGSINMTSTVTGRFSASNPNLQNVPKGKTSQIKSVFTSRFGAKGKIIQSDFSALEVYIQANLTQDEQLISDLRAGLDMHCARLATAEGMEYDEVFRLAKGKGEIDAALRKLWDEKRTAIKVFSFQRAYGAGAPKIAAGLKIPVEVVEGWVEADKIRYPGVESWYEKLTVSIQQSRKPTSRFLMHPEVPGLNIQLGRGTYQAPSGKIYTWTEVPAPKWQVKRGTLTSFMPTEIRNYPVQGEGGEFMKAALWLAVREFYTRKNFDGLALLVNTVHDATYLDADEKVARKAAVLLHACMEAASDFMEFYFDWPLPVGVPSDTSWGSSMIEEIGYDEKFNEQSAQVRSYLRTKYMEGRVPSFILEN
jgi:DNA polymerase I - 3''-5'' exonuclease and polymerase domains